MLLPCLDKCANVYLTPCYFTRRLTHMEFFLLNLINQCQSIEIIANFFVDTCAKHARYVFSTGIQAIFIVGPLVVIFDGLRRLCSFLRRVGEGLHLLALQEAETTADDEVALGQQQQFDVDDDVIVVQSPAGNQQINNNDVGLVGTVLQGNGAWVSVTITAVGEIAGPVRSFRRSNLNLNLG